MASLQQLNRKEALKFLESREVQGALVDTFCSLYTQQERAEILANGFWKFAEEESKAQQPGKRERGKFTYEIQLLCDLFLALKGMHPAGDPLNGSLGGLKEYPLDFNFTTTRRHIRDKFRQHASRLARLDIKLLEGFHQPHCVLAVFPSRELASASHAKRGRPAKYRIDYPSDPVSRRIENLRKSTPLILPRPEIAKLANDFMHQEQDLVLVLCGSCNSGKTAWMLDYHDAHAQDNALYPFDKRTEELSSQKLLSQHLALKCVQWASLSKSPGVLATLSTLEELWANLAALGPQMKGKPVVLFDAIEQAGPCLDPVLRFIHQCVNQEPNVLRFIVTVRTPTNLLPRLENLPRARVSRIFDSERAVLEYMKSWRRAAEAKRPVRIESLHSIYERAGANLQLAATMMSELLGGKHEK